MLTTSKLVARNLRYHARGNLAVLLGVAVASAVFTGALLVGDSLRGSLRDRIERQLGGIDSVAFFPRPVRADIADQLPGQVAPVLLLPGSAQADGDPATAPYLGKVTVLGVDDRFAPAGAAEVDWKAAGRQAVLSARVAEKLGAKAGDKVRLGVERFSELPRSSSLAKRDSADVTATDLPPEPHQALYRRWRAQTFSGIVGQTAVVETLRNAVRTGQVAHALLFVGPRGTGKTSMARIIAKALNCTALDDGQPCDRCEACTSIREGRALDVVEMDAASNNRVDDMRDLLARTMTAPSDLRRKVFIVDEVQRITQGWDVLLRTLEEPPEHVVFIFCTTDASQIRPAVLSRVQRFDFRRLTVAQIEGKLRTILDADGRVAEPEAVRLIARLAAVPAPRERR